MNILFLLLTLVILSSYASDAYCSLSINKEPLSVNCCTLDSTINHRGLEIENRQLKERLTFITDSLRSRAIYEEAITRQIEGQKKDKEKQLIKEKQSLIEKVNELDVEKVRLRRLTIIGVAFIIITLLAITYLYIKHRNTLNIETHRAELMIQREKEIKQRFMIENISGRIEAQEAERERISRELHDGIGGNLVAIRLQLQSMDNDNPTIEELQRLVAKTHEEIRSISHNLATPRLDEIPFEQLFHHHIRHLNTSSGQSVDGVLLPQTGWSGLDLKFQTELFRLIQELSGNIIKHSKATKVTLTLRQDSSTINLLAEDNGIGFITDKGYEGIGLQNIRLRVNSLNGSLDLTSNPGKGTIFIIDIPIKK